MPDPIDFSSVFENLDDAACIIEQLPLQPNGLRNYRYIAVNKAFNSLFGTSNLIGQSIRETFPDEPEIWYEDFDRVLETGIPARVQREAPSQLFLEIYVARLNNGNDNRLIVTMRDVTRRREMEKKLRESEGRQTFLLKISDIFRTISDPDQIWQETMRLLGEHLGLSRAYYFNVVANGNSWTHIIEPGYQKDPNALRFVGPYALENFNSEMFEGFARGEVIAAADIEILPGLTEAQRESYRAVGVAAFINVPLLRNGAYSAGIGAHFTTPHNWTQHEIDLIRELAARTWTAAEKAIAEQALQKSEEKYRTLFNSIDECFCIIQMIFDEKQNPVDYLVLEANPALYKLTGLTDAIGKSMRELAPAHEQFWYDKYGTIAVTGMPARFEHEAAALNRWYDVYAFPIGEPQEMKVAVIFTDITERKLHEQQQAFLLNFSDKLRVLDSERLIKEKAVKMLFEYLKLDRCWISEVFEQQGISTVGPEYFRRDLTPMSGIFKLSDYPETMRQLATQSMIIENSAHDARFSTAEKQLLAGLNLQALLVTALHLGQEKTIWALAATTSVPRNWTNNERVLLENIAERTWAAIERAKAEEALRKSEKRFQSIANLVPDLLWDSEPDGSTNWLNYKWLAFTGQSLEEATDWGWVNAIHPDDREASTKGYNEAVEAGKNLQQEHRIRRHDGAYRWFVVKASPVINEHGQVVKVYGSATDIHDSKTAEEALRESELRFRSFVAASSELVYRMSADWREMYLLSGNDFMVNTNEPNTNWIDMYIPTEDRVLAWSAISEAIYRKEVFEFEHRVIRTDGSIGWAASRAIPILDEHGNIKEWIGAAANITDRKEAEQKLRTFNKRLEKEIAERTAELKSSKELLQATLDSNPEMIQVFKAVRNEEGNIIDFVWVLNNAASEKTYGDVIGKRLLEITPGVYEEGIFNAFVEVTETGIPQQYEKSYVHEQFNGWIYQSVVKMDDGVATNTINITDRKLAELQLEKNRDQLQSILDTTLVQMSMMQAVRNDEGDIIDLRITMVNKELERETGRTDLVGKLYAEEYPGVKATGLFNLILKVIETGTPQATEYYYPYDGFDKWFSCMFIKMNDGVVATNMDITARKQAEEERFKNYLLLQQSEDLALLGSWEYHLLTGTFTWSDGMCRLFDLEKGTEIQPEIYLAYATPECLEKAQRVVHYIRSGESRFEETLEINVSGQIKAIHLKATVVHNNEGHATRVLGVDRDISAMRAAEQKIRQMETEQQLEIFRVTLRTQEEERRRISESLHNGLGQLLYAIKISLSQLTAKRLEKHPEEFESAKRYTSELIADAMRDTRQISHGLMPPILSEFGLEAAVNDVCERMQDGIRFHCSVELGDVVLDKYMQLAVFRTIQELMINVARHAKATESHAKIFIANKSVIIRVSDNGIGMDASKQGKETKEGIGLASIRSKADLLDGSMQIDSAPDGGTTITVTLPYHVNSKL